jgi:hypothetical protein
MRLPGTKVIFKLGTRSKGGFLYVMRKYRFANRSQRRLFLDGRRLRGCDPCPKKVTRSATPSPPKKKKKCMRPVNKIKMFAVLQHSGRFWPTPTEDVVGKEEECRPDSLIWPPRIFKIFGARRSH